MTVKIKTFKLICVLILFSCQSKDLEKERKIINQTIINPIDGSNIEGHYQAKFTTLNPHINGTIPGSANLYRLHNRLFAYVRLFGGGVNARNMQNIYIGSRCPTLLDDQIQDVIIDRTEAESV